MHLQVFGRQLQSLAYCILTSILIGCRITRNQGDKGQILITLIELVFALDPLGLQSCRIESHTMDPNKGNQQVNRPVKVVGFHVEGASPSPKAYAPLQDSITRSSPSPVIIPPAFQVSI